MLELDKIKNGSKVLSVLTKPLFFDDICRHTSLDKKSLQKTLAKLRKNGYIVKDHRNLWAPVDLKS